MSVSKALYFRLFLARILEHDMSDTPDTKHASFILRLTEPQGKLDLLARTAGNQTPTSQHPEELSHHSIVF
jgi:hypothetical protein